MHLFLRPALATVALLAVLAPTTARAQSTFTSLAEFVAATGPSGVDTYDDLTPFGIFAGPVVRDAGGFDYSVRSSASPINLLFPLENPDEAGDVWLSTESADAALNFSGFDAGTTAIGGRFFATDLNGGVSGTRIFLRAEDIMGNMIEETLTPLSADAFFGVVFDFSLVSLRFIAENDLQSTQTYFATVNDLVLAGATTTVPVPEPTTLWLVAVPLVLLMARRRRRSA